MNQEPPRCIHNNLRPACDQCQVDLIESLDLGGHRTLEQDNNANSDLRRARTTRFHVNREPK